jgi:hypothetical protein
MCGLLNINSFKAKLILHIPTSSENKYHFPFSYNYLVNLFFKNSIYFKNIT